MTPEEAVERSKNEYVKVFNEPILAVIDDTIALEALDDFLVVQEDKFRTGYECKTCDGNGHLNKQCTKCHGDRTEKITDVCDNCQGVGRVANLFRELEKSDVAVTTKRCNQCDGTGKKDLKGLQEGLYPCRACLIVTDVSGRTGSCGFEPCPTCHGKAVALVVPEESMRRPNSGIVRSTGPKVSSLKTGDRVLYSNHTGYEIYFKRNLKFRQMREHEVMSRIHGVGEIHKVLE